MNQRGASAISALLRVIVSMGFEAAGDCDMPSGWVPWENGSGRKSKVP